MGYDSIIKVVARSSNLCSITKMLFYLFTIIIAEKSSAKKNERIPAVGETISKTNICSTEYIAWLEKNSEVGYSQLTREKNMKVSQVTN